MVVGPRGEACAATGTRGRGSYSVIGCDDDVLVIGWITTKFRTTSEWGTSEHHDDRVSDHQ